MPARTAASACPLAPSWVALTFPLASNANVALRFAAASRAGDAMYLPAAVRAWGAIVFSVALALLPLVNGLWLASVPRWLCHAPVQRPGSMKFSVPPADSGAASEQAFVSASRVSDKVRGFLGRLSDLSGGKSSAREPSGASSAQPEKSACSSGEAEAA